MTTTHDDGMGQGPLRRLSPYQVRNASFSRTPLGRRGLSEDEVQAFVQRMGEEVAARDAEIVQLMDENRRVKQAMHDWQSQHAEGVRQTRQDQPVSYVDQPTFDLRERAAAETAALMARAQQHIDAQVAQAELYCRRREQEAVQRYDEIVRHARAQAAEDAERVAHHYRMSAGPGYSRDQERVHRQQAYLSAMLKALDALGAHLHATREAFAIEVTKLADATSDGPHTSTPTPPGMTVQHAED